jgi:hypothetical protein
MSFRVDPAIFSFGGWAEYIEVTSHVAPSRLKRKPRKKKWFRGMAEDQGSIAVCEYLAVSMLPAGMKRVTVTGVRGGGS